MKREDIRRRIEEIGIIPSVRVSSTEDAMFAAEAVSQGGIPIVEVAMTVPEAAQGHFPSRKERARDDRRRGKCPGCRNGPPVPRSRRPVCDQ